LEKGQDGQPLVLMLLDWSARVMNACDAEIKAISAYYSILLVSLKALKPELMDKVQVIYQSEAILADPSNYWISVINVGRHFMLNDVMGTDLVDSDGVGHVIARLMKVADVAGVEPKSVALVDDSSSAVESKLIAEFFKEKLDNMTQPEITSGGGPSLLLYQRELEAHKTENDEYYLLDDPKVSDAMEYFCRFFTFNGNLAYKPAFCFALPSFRFRSMENRN
jgi:hypothetical protein